MTQKFELYLNKLYLFKLLLLNSTNALNANQEII